MADRRLHEFVRALRGAGVRVSPTEAEEAFRAAALIGYHPREQFRETLALTLVKSQPERPDFDACFEAFFHFESAEEEDAAQPQADAEPLSPQEGQGLSEQAAELVAQDAGQLEQTLARNAGEMDFTDMQVITQQGLYARRLLMTKRQSKTTTPRWSTVLLV